MNVQSSLDRLPRATLGHFPTPLERLKGLEKSLGGPNLYVKRDDCTGLALGGNKVRKLEFLCGEALEHGASTLVTHGAVQSNHARQTAAAAARLGMNCEIVLSRPVPRSDDDYENSGNILLDRIMGARIRLVHDFEEAESVAVGLIDEIESRGGKCYEIPPGGSSVVGSVGYVNAGLELASQLAELGIEPTKVVTAAATVGTMAGLLTGLRAAGVGAEVLGISVYETGAARQPELERLLAGLAELFRCPPATGWRLVDGYLGDGYGIPTREMRAAVELCARTEGLLLDPVYTGKAMAGLIDLVGTGEIGPEETVVFLHSGGTPGLFAYRDVFADESSTSS